MRLNVLFRQNNSRLKVCFNNCSDRLLVQFKNAYRVTTIDENMLYNGPYFVDPTQEVQTLQTKKKFLKKEITINSVQMGLATISQIDRLFNGG